MVKMYKGRCQDGPLAGQELEYFSPNHEVRADANVGEDGALVDPTKPRPVIAGYYSFDVSNGIWHWFPVPE